MDNKLLIEKLIDAAGKENVFTDNEHLIIYQRGSIDPLKHMPLAVVKITDEKNISRVIKIANEFNINIIARGGGSSPTGAVVPDDNTLIMDLRPLNKINVSIEDGYVEAYAGATLQEVNEECKKYNFFFPPDPSSVSVSTVGGAINENSGGMRCARYGVVKDWILKLDVVLADGSETTFGEAIYKNRGGFNIIDLIAGSEGTLCIVKKAWLKIIAMPKKIYRIAGFYDNINDAMDAILAIRKLNPLILEFSDYYGIVAANKIRGFSYPETRGGMVLADTDFDESYLEDIKKIMEKNASKIIIPENKDEFNNIFEVRRIAFTAPGILFPGFIDGDVVVPLSKLKDMINFVYKTREKYGVYIATCGHAGDGNLHPQIGGNPDDHENWRNVLLAMDDINIEAVRLGGSISGEHGIGRIKKDLLLKQLKYKKQDETIIIMKNLKKMFDPKNILNRGNFFD